MAAIVRVAVLMPLIVTGRSGGFGDWKWMKDGANPNMCLHEGCVSVGEREIYLHVH